MQFFGWGARCHPWAITVLVDKADQAPKAATSSSTDAHHADVVRLSQVARLGEDKCAEALERFKGDHAQHFRGCYTQLLDGILGSMVTPHPLQSGRLERERSALNAALDCDVQSNSARRLAGCPPALKRAWRTFEALVRDDRDAQPLSSLPRWTRAQQDLCFQHIRDVLAQWRHVKRSRVAGADVVLSSCLDG